MQGTRDNVLEFIVQHREVRVEELAAELGVTTAAVRRHLDHLRADGMVDMRAVKQSTGRPYYAYHPTERALGSLPDGYASILERVLRSVEGREGVAEQMAESVAQRHRGEMLDAEDEQLIVQVTESLRSEGILESWHSEHDGYHLMNSTCPYLKAAEVSNLPCESDRKAIELLLGQKVTQLNRIVDGAPQCEYLVRARNERESTTNQGAS